MDSKTLWLNIVGDLHDRSSTTLGDHLTLLVYKKITDLLQMVLLFFVLFHRNDADDASSSIYETDEEESDNVNAFSF